MQKVFQKSFAVFVVGTERKGTDVYFFYGAVEVGIGHLFFFAVARKSM